MLIVKSGTLPGGQKAEMTCTNCGCVFIAEQKEFSFISDQRDGDFWRIQCPHSGCNTALYK